MLLMLITFHAIFYYDLLLNKLQYFHKLFAEVVQPTTRAKTTTIVGAVSARGIINIKVRVPYIA